MTPSDETVSRVPPLPVIEYRVERRSKMAYVDVRGPNPILIIGLATWTLSGAKRTISVEDAMTRIGVTG
jgi:hypothetical protein